MVELVATRAVMPMIESWLTSALSQLSAKDRGRLDVDAYRPAGEGLIRMLRADCHWAWPNIETVEGTIDPCRNPPAYMSSRSPATRSQ